MLLVMHVTRQLDHPCIRPTIILLVFRVVLVKEDIMTILILCTAQIVISLVLHVQDHLTQTV